MITSPCDGCGIVDRCLGAGVLIKGATPSPCPRWRDPKLQAILDAKNLPHDQVKAYMRGWRDGAANFGSSGPSRECLKQAYRDGYENGIKAARDERKQAEKKYV